jgi:hypothetical protein
MQLLRLFRTVARKDSVGLTSDESLSARADSHYCLADLPTVNTVPDVLSPLGSYRTATRLDNRLK